MDVNRYTEKTQEALLRAQRIASERGNPQIDPEHLLAALLEQRDGVVPQVILQLGAIHSDCASTWSRLSRGSRRPRGATAQPGPSPALSRILQAAEREADGLRDEYVSTEHVLLAMADSSCG